MEEEGIVSIWLGNFESKEALTLYAENRFKRNENGEKVPSFTQDFFGGDLWPFEPEVFDYEWNGDPSQDPLVVGAPLGEELCAALAEVYSKGFDQPYNAVLAVYDYQFEGSRHVPGAPAQYVGSFSYIER